MQAAARVKAAITLIDMLGSSNQSVADLLRQWGRHNRYAGSGDRAAISGLVYETIRKYHSSAYLLQDDTARARILGAIWQYSGGDMDLCQNVFDGSAYGPEKLTAHEISTLKGTDLATAPAHIRADYPLWLEGELKETFGSDLEKELAALAQRAPLILRANIRKNSREACAELLQEWNVTKTRYAPHGLFLAERDIFKKLPNLEQGDAFKAGLFDVQDEASQICASLVSHMAGAGEVLDYCAGAGGKALAISEMSRQAHIVATDSDAKRLEPLSLRMKRLGADNIQIAQMSHISGLFDVVLVDAPCSGSGTWRRNPELKWRLDEATLANRLRAQREVLEGASKYVKSGGALVYATCAILACENSVQVQKFCADHPDFRPENWTQFWAGTDDLRLSQVSRTIDAGDHLQLSPFSTRTDGFFVSILKRK